MKPTGSGGASGEKNSKSYSSSCGSRDTNNNVLFVQESHVAFEPPNQKVSVFFDECNREIIRLTSGVVVGNTTASSNPNSASTSTFSSSPTKTRVVFQATDRMDKAEFLLPIEKRILSIKFNSNRTVLAYHVEKSNVEFINVKQLIKNKRQSTESERDLVELEQSYVLDDKRYVQASRAKNSKLFGFLWTGPMELVMVTDISVEYYHVESIKRKLKHIKSFQSSTNWFVYQPCHVVGQSSAQRQSFLLDQLNDDVTTSARQEVDLAQPITPRQSTTSLYSIIMVSTGSLGNSMQPYMFSKGQIFKLNKFDVDGNWNNGEKAELFERSITIASIYGQVRLLVLQHESLNTKTKGAQILLYTVDHECGQTNLTHTLDLDINGRFAINILDNLVVAHDQPSKTSFIFDIMIESTEKSDCSKHFVSLLSKQTIKPSKSKVKNIDIELYSKNWVFFQPNFIIDAKAGLLLTLHLNLHGIKDQIPDSLMLLNFLAYRKHSEQIILDECRDIVARSHKQAVEITNNQQFTCSPLMDVSSAFDVLGKLVISAPEISNNRRKRQTGSSRVADPQEHQRQTRQQASSMLQQASPCTDNGGVYSARLAQEDISREVLGQLTKFNVEDPSNYHFISSTLLEFIFACRKQEKNVDFCIYELLVNCLFGAKRYYQLVQMIRANILKDSKQLACLLLTNRNLYPPATQLGLDMLQRLNCLNDLIESLSLAPPNSTARRSRNSSNSDTVSRLSFVINQSIEVDQF